MLQDEDLDTLRNLCSNALLAIGQIGISPLRSYLGTKLLSLGYDLPVVISPSAYVSRHSSIDIGTTVGHGAVINAGATIGKNCIINSKSLVEHDVSIGDLCHVSTGVLLNGGSSIGSGTFIGSGSIVRESLQLPENTVISAGQRVMGWPIRQSTNS